MIKIFMLIRIGLLKFPTIFNGLLIKLIQTKLQLMILIVSWNKEDEKD